MNCDLSTRSGGGGNKRASQCIVAEAKNSDQTHAMTMDDFRDFLSAGP